MNKREAFLMGAMSARPRTEYVIREVNITDKRAPTDQSVALLKEMEEAARQKIITTIPLADNSINGEILLEKGAFGFKRRAVLIARINGVKIEVLAESDEDKSWQELADKLVRATAERLAIELIAPAFAQALSHGRWPK